LYRPLNDHVEVADDLLLVCASPASQADAEAPLMVMSVALRPRTLVERHQISLDELPAPLRLRVAGRRALPKLLDRPTCLSMWPSGSASRRCDRCEAAGLCAQGAT
jgi:hypothetical protein